MKTKHQEAIDTLTDLERIRQHALNETFGAFFCSATKDAAYRAFQSAARDVNTYCDRIHATFPREQAWAIINGASERAQASAARTRQ